MNPTNQQLLDELIPDWRSMPSRDIIIALLGILATREVGDAPGRLAEAATDPFERGGGE